MTHQATDKADAIRQAITALNKELAEGAQRGIKTELKLLDVSDVGSAPYQILSAETYVSV